MENKQIHKRNDRIIKKKANKNTSTLEIRTQTMSMIIISHIRFTSKLAGQLRNTV